MAQCTARSHRTGERCRRAAISGGRVCYVHGGNAPQVKRSARERINELIDPALNVLARLVTARGVMDRDSLRAAQDILDRAGYKPTEHLEQAGTLRLIIDETDDTDERKFRTNGHHSTAPEA